MVTEKTHPNFNDANYHQNAFIAVSQAGQIHICIFVPMRGAAALSPTILLKIILLAYSRGCTSSRVIANYKYYKARTEPFDRVLKETYGNSYT